MIYFKVVPLILALFPLCL